MMSSYTARTSAEASAYSINPNVAISIAIAGGLGPAGQGFYHTGSTDAHARVQERIQEAVENRVNRLFRNRSLVRQAEAHRQLLVDLDPNGVRERSAATVALVGDHDGRLQDRSAVAIDIKLASRKPTQIAGIGRVE